MSPRLGAALAHRLAAGDRLVSTQKAEHTAPAAADTDAPDPEMPKHVADTPDFAVRPDAPKPTGEQWLNAFASAFADVAAEVAAMNGDRSEAEQDHAMMPAEALGECVDTAMDGLPRSSCCWCRTPPASACFSA